MNRFVRRSLVKNVWREKRNFKKLVVERNRDIAIYIDFRIQKQSVRYLFVNLVSKIKYCGMYVSSRIYLFIDWTGKWL